jgi:hypothetical protein
MSNQRTPEPQAQRSQVDSGDVYYDDITTQVYDQVFSWKASIAAVKSRPGSAPRKVNGSLLLDGDSVRDLVIGNAPSPYK